MNPHDILDQLNELTAKVKDLIAADSFDDGEGTTEYVTEEGDDYHFLRAGKGYASDVDILSTVRDTENGYIFFFPAYNSTSQDNYVCLDYAEAEYIWKLLSYIRKGQKQ